jgi:4-alpha-glucanotransferase
VLAIAAAKAGGRIVGENLGTVPPETNRTLRKRGMLGMYVVQFAYSVDDEPHAPAANDLACVDTHDTATFAQYWHDLEPPARGALLDTLRAAGCLATTSGETPDPTEVLSAVLAWLGTTDAEVVLATLEDLWLELDPQNVPGTTGEEHPNFRRRCARSLADLDASDHERELLCRIDRARQGRSPSP